VLDVATALACILAATLALRFVWDALAPRGARRGVRWLACCAVALPLVVLALWRLSNARTLQVLGDLVVRVATDEPVVALTFDDGPRPGSTERILDVLAAADVRATFFLEGASIAAAPRETRAIVAAGHEVGNHSWHHPRMIGLSLERIRDEIERTDDAIRGAGYRGEIHFRSPHGKKLVALPYFLARTGRTNVFFDVEPDSDPVLARSSAAIARHVVDNVRPGSIVLLHVMSDGYAASAAAVPAILDGLARRGFRFVTVSQLLALRSAS